MKKLFKLFVSFLQEVDLIGCETIAIDGTKSRAHNSKKANFNQKKIDKHLAYIEVKTQEPCTCPQGETLKTTGSWHKKTTDRDSYEFKRYRTPNAENAL